MQRKFAQPQELRRYKIHDRYWNEEYSQCNLGCWGERFGPGYSGEAVYAAEVKLNQSLRTGQLYEIDLGKVECTAAVRVDGKPVGIAWAHPKRVVFDGRIACGKTEFSLEIEVANTLANQFNTQPPETLYAEENLGQYQVRLASFEKSAPIGGLYGPVILSELS